MHCQHVDTRQVLLAGIFSNLYIAYRLNYVAIPVSALQENRIFQSLAKWQTEFTLRISTKSKLAVFMIEPSGSDLTHELSANAELTSVGNLLKCRYLKKTPQRKE